MERRECTENDRGLFEARSVEINTQQLVNPSKTSWVSLHRVVGWSQTIQIFIPGWRARESQLDEDGDHADVSESPGVQRGSSGGAEEEKDQ